MLKYIYGFFLCFLIINLKAQTLPNVGQHFTDAIKISTGWDYSQSTIYTAGAADQYWRVLYKEGGDLLQPQVGNLFEDSGWWILSGDGSKYQWVNVSTDEGGSYFYRLNFCIDGISSINSLSGKIAADNTVKSIRLDGTTLVDFSQYSSCEDNRSLDYRCYKDFSAVIDNALLFPGAHILEIEISNEAGSVTGMNINAQLLGVSGWVLPSNGNYSISGCEMKGQIRGVAFEDLNMSKVKDANESRLSNVQISLLDANNNNLIKSVYTDLGGAYNFYGLDRSKDYKVICSPVNPYVQTTPVSPNYYTIHFDVATLIADKDFGLYKSVIQTISGVVFSDKNKNRVRDNGENLLAGYTIQLLDQQNQNVSSTQTNANGSYTLTGNFLQTYSVKVIAQTNDQVTTPITGEYTFLLSENMTGIDFGIYLYVPSCQECVTSFSPTAGEEYIISAWVKESVTGNPPTTYTHSGVRITFNDGAVNTFPLFRPTGPIVDGWQRIEASFIIPAGAQNIHIALVNESPDTDVFFDDIRIHPYNSNMKSFVYNPSTQKLVAELDENNFATMYEYDDEGILIRVKKETERGVMTIKETRSNQSKVR